MRRRAISVGHRYFSRIGWATAVHAAANGHCIRSSSMEATKTFGFLGENVELTKQPAVEKVRDQGPVSRKTRKAICETQCHLLVLEADLLFTR